MSTQDVTSREGLSRGAEAWREKRADETGEEDKGKKARGVGRGRVPIRAGPSGVNHAMLRVVTLAAAKGMP